MPSGFRSFQYHVARAQEGGGLESLGPRSLTAHESSAMTAGDRAGAFVNDEAAARYYLNGLFVVEPGLESLAAAGEPAMVPELHRIAEPDGTPANTHLVRFRQEQDGIPVFGSNVVIELDENRRLVSADADVGEIGQVSPIAKLSPSQALRRIGRFAHKRKGLDTVTAPKLYYFYNEGAQSWHLAYHFTEVPVSPPELEEEEEEMLGFGHGGPSPRTSHLEFDYFVDAHDGSILFYYSSHPNLDLPVQSRGQDEDAREHIFWGRKIGNRFALDDPLRVIKTYDLGLADLEKARLPGAPVTHDSANWADTNRAAVSAHVNAMRVYDFFKAELKRDGIDDKGMELVSIVNCILPSKQKPPEWSNACWWKKRMWYGQVKDGSGQLRSYARYLDIIAHELTHGVTEATAKLIYKNQPGALNESFSDIFGVIIRNWYEVGPDSDVSNWTWTIGHGLGREGQGLRDMKNPARLKFDARLLGRGKSGLVSYPAHMNDYYTTLADDGGVHINSNIHNKAAYNMLTIGDDFGNRIFTPREVALLYYLTLQRLGRLADFAKALGILVFVASSFYIGEPAVMSNKVNAIKRAYEAVGIR